MINVDDARRAWRKATYSSGSGANCVEVAVMPAGIAIRDSKNPSQPFLAVRAEVFARFIDRIKDDGVR